MLVGPFGLAAERIGLAGLRALLVTGLVAYVVFFGLLLFRLMSRGGAIERLSEALARLPGDRSTRTLVLTLPLGAFFEAVSGFGIAVVVVAPLLIALGFSPARAALLALLTQNAVPWGSLAIGVILSGEIAAMPAWQIGLGCAYASALLFPYYAGLALLLSDGPAGLRRGLPVALAVGAMMALAAGLGTWLLGVELAMVVGGPLVAVAAVGLLRLRDGPGAPAPVGAGRPGTGLPLARAVAPYVLLSALLLLSRLVEPLRVWMQSHAVLTVEAVGAGLPLLYSPGFLLLVASAMAVPLLRLGPGQVLAEVGGTVRPWLRATLALAGFMLLSELMLQSGMTARLASAVADGLGPAYVLAAPALGGLSGFLTGSNAAGSAMLLPFQIRVAEELGLPSIVMVSVQNTAAAALSMASPQRVVLAAAVVGRPGDEPHLVRAALLIGLGSTALITAAELAWLALWPAG